MHARVVVNASVLVSQVSSREAYHVASSAWIAHYMADDGLLVEPEFVLIEVASAISRQTGQTKFAEQVAQTLQQSDAISLIALDDTLLQEGVRIAANLRLRAGDSIYVALARQLNIPLISWDKEQLQRASTLIETYTPDSYPF